MVTIPLTMGYSAIIDDEDAHLAQHKWCAAKREKTVYAQRRVWRADGTSTIVLLHQEVLGVKWADHIDRNGLNCRRSNLRPATRKQQQANRGKQVNNSSGFKGVHRYPHGKWRAQLTQDGKRVHIGMYDTAEEAARAYDEKARLTWGEFASTNF